MTNCSKNCMWYTPDCERFDCCECDCNPERIAYEQGYKDGAIEALKYIRDKIQGMVDNVPYTSQLSIDAHKRDIDIVREKINELKRS